MYLTWQIKYSYWVSVQLNKTLCVLIIFQNIFNNMEKNSQGITPEI